MTVELADIHVEDIKAGYVLHHPEHGICEVMGDAWEGTDPLTGGERVDLWLSSQGEHSWQTFARGEIVQVEA